MPEYSEHIQLILSISLIVLIAFTFLISIRYKATLAGTKGIRQIRKNLKALRFGSIFSIGLMLTMTLNYLLEIILIETDMELFTTVRFMFKALLTVIMLITILTILTVTYINFKKEKNG